MSSAEIERLRASVQQVRATSETIKTRALAARSRAEAEFGRMRPQLAAMRAQGAKDNREGRNGEERRRLQERIDRGETTWEKVMHGQDDDPTAARVRDEARREMTSAVGELLDQDRELARDVEERERGRGGRRD